MTQEPTRAERVIAVTVVRSGGVAGLLREWRVEPSPAVAPEWEELVRSCPWEDAEATPVGADRYVWSIEAVTEEQQRSAELGDTQMLGPWRELVDRVREEGR